MNTGTHGMMLCAVPDRDTGLRIANILVGDRLAACIQLMPVDSVYRWQGKVESASETLMLIKTRSDLFDAATVRIRTLHPYEVPEIVTIPFASGLAEYFAWMDAAT